MATKENKALVERIQELEAENIELRQRAGELPEMPRNLQGLPFSAPRLIVARMRRGISVPEMAKKLGVDKRTYIGYESETVAPTMEQIGKMAMLSGFPLRFFFAEFEPLMSFSATSLGPYEWDADTIHIKKWGA